MNKNLSISIDRLRKLEPLSSLSDERLEELVGLSYVEKLPVGVSVFHEGDIDNQTVYLLEGDVQLTSSDNKTDKVLTSKQPEAKYPLDDSQPRQVSCSAMSRVELVRIDNSVLDYMMMWDQLAVSEEAAADDANESQPSENTASQTAQAKSDQKDDSQTSADKKDETTPHTSTEQGAPEKSESAPSPQKEKPAADIVDNKPQHATKKTDIDDSEPVIPDFMKEDDKSWIRKMRHIMAFKNMPPANIKALLENMETIIVEKDQVVVQQGDEGDYYFVLTEGEAKVTRTVELATLGAGASFGEEALVADSKRNASVTMTTDGMLMRLSKQKFSQLLKDPMLARISPDDARSKVNKGAIWLDVRHAKEFSFARLPKAINIPLHEVRIRVGELDKSKQYICYCSTGRRSSAAAFLLVQLGFDACVLNGGIKVMASDLVQ